MLTMLEFEPDHSCITVSQDPLLCARVTTAPTRARTAQVAGRDTQSTFHLIGQVAGK